MAWFRYFPENPGWSFQIVRVLNHIGQGGADFGELSRALSRMEVGNPESWCQELTRQAAAVEAQGREAMDRGRRISGRDILFRAANYYRLAEFYLAPDDPRRISLSQKMMDCFKVSAALVDPPLEYFEVPYAHSSLPGFIVWPRRAPGDTTPPPVVVRIGGADSTKEETFFSGSRLLAERGVAVVNVDFPGQGESLRMRKIYSLPEYERPVGAVIDYLTGRDDLDVDRLGIFCASFGGYYGARVAAFEPRVRALVVWGANFDPLKDIYEFFPPIQKTLRWLLGIDSDAEARERLQAFDLSAVSGRVTCPTLICHGSEDFIVAPAAATKLYDFVSGPKELHWWTSETGGETHCMMDGLSRPMPMMVDWMVERLQGAPL